MLTVFAGCASGGGDGHAAGEAGPEFSADSI